MDNSNDLLVLLRSRHPLVLAEMKEEERFFDILGRAAEELDLPVWRWSSTIGLARDGCPAQYLTTDPVRALDFVSCLSDPGVFVFADAHPVLRDPRVVRRTKEVAQGARPGQTVVLTAPHHEVPPELASLAHRWTLKPPDRGELLRLVNRTLRDLAGRSFDVAVRLDDVDAIVDALAGLTVHEAERLIQQAALADGAITPEDVPRIRSAKAELLAGDGILELVEADAGTLERVGGFDNLKQWLRVRSRAMQREAAAMGLDPPRGVLLTGVPGCGKSLVAKSIAGGWGLPLVLLDPARLYSKWIGETEERLAGALDTVEAMAPVVLWIDEIEKGFAGGGEADGGTSKRLLGTFLRWMQDRRGEIFLVATANDVAALPPELLRKGRFDEIFFVDLPDAAAREEILRLHLEARGVDASDLDLGELAGLTEGFSGAEIETVVVAALYRALADDGRLDGDRLRAEIAATVPLSVLRAEDMFRLRAWASERAVAA